MVSSLKQLLLLVLLLISQLFYIILYFTVVRKKVKRKVLIIAITLNSYSCVLISCCPMGKSLYRSKKVL